MEYKVNLIRSIHPDCEPFEEDDDNLIEVKVYSNAKNISKECRVFLTFSKNGLIGFATELLRYAHEWEKAEGKHKHLYPIVQGDDIVQAVGVCLTPESSETIIEFYCFEKNINEFAKSQPEKGEVKKMTFDSPNIEEAQELTEVLKQVSPILGFIPKFNQNGDNSG